MKSSIVLAAVAVASMAVGAAGMAGGMHHAGAMHGHAAPAEGMDAFFDQALADLDVSDSQRTKVLEVKERLSADFERLHGAHAAMHAALMRAWEQDHMDAAELHRMADARMEELRGTLQEVVDGVVEIHDTLTPEQRSRLTAKVKEMHGHP